MLESAHALFDIVPLNTVGIIGTQITANLFKKYTVS